MEPSAIAALLKTARQEKGLSQKELACLMGCARQTVGILESPEISKASFSLVLLACKTLGLTLSIEISKKPQNFVSLPVSNSNIEFVQEPWFTV